MTQHDRWSDTIETRRAVFEVPSKNLTDTCEALVHEKSGMYTRSRLFELVRTVDEAQAMYILTSLQYQQLMCVAYVCSINSNPRACICNFQHLLLTRPG
jgi:hypothetical protein